MRPGLALDSRRLSTNEFERFRSQRTQAERADHLADLKRRSDVDHKLQEFTRSMRECAGALRSNHVPTEPLLTVAVEGVLRKVGLFRNKTAWDFHVDELATADGWSLRDGLAIDESGAQQIPEPQPLTRATPLRPRRTRDAPSPRRSTGARIVNGWFTIIPRRHSRRSSTRSLPRPQ